MLCHLLEPPCGEVADEDDSLDLLPPCRSICMAALASCQSKLSHSQLEGDQLGHRSLDVATDLHDLLPCELFPIDDGLGYCTNDFNHDHSMLHFLLWSDLAKIR